MAKAFGTLIVALGLACGSAQAEEPRSAADKEGGVSFVAMPVPVSNPALGNGLALTTIALYSPGRSPQPWITGAGGLYTDSDSWAAGVFQRAHLAGDKVRVTAGLGIGDFKLDFYGIGSGAGARDRSIPIDQRGGGGLAQVLFKVAPNLYVGPVYRGLRTRTSLNLSELPFPDLQIPEVELRSESSALGLAAEYDTRDAQFAPRKGVYATGQWIKASEALGSDFNYSRFELAANAYHALSAKSVVAGRISYCETSGHTPFYDLCLFGQNNDLRGYDAGRYRDHTMYAAQVEYRRDLFWRIGAVAFAGVGNVAPSFGELDGKLLPSAGVGLRFKASEQQRVNASIDFAFGEDSQAFYFYIGEAF